MKRGARARSTIASRAAVASVASTLAAVVVATTASAAAPARRATAEPIAFTYAWPANLDVAVRQTRGRERVGQGRQSQTIHYRLGLEPAADGMVVRPGAFEVELPGGEPGAAPRRELMPFQFARAAAVPFRVDREGRFAGLVDLAAAQQGLRAVLPSGEGASAAALEAATSKPVVETAARDYWDPIVGAWVGQRFAPDAAYEYDDEIDLSDIGLEGLPAIPAKGQVYVRRAPPCERGGRTYRCVYVEHEVRVDAAAFAAALQKGGGAEAGPSLREGSIVTTSTLLVEPDTLIPHEYDYERAARFTPAGDGAVEVTTLEFDRREYAYGVAGPAKPARPP
jgi:hypothetical protein